MSPPTRPGGNICWNCGQKRGPASPGALRYQCGTCDVTWYAGELPRRPDAGPPLERRFIDHAVVHAPAPA